MICCRSLLIYLPTNISGARTRARAGMKANKSPQKEDIRESLFMVGAPNRLLASSLSFELATRFC